MSAVKTDVHLPQYAVECAFDYPLQHPMHRSSFAAAAAGWARR